MRFSLYSVHLSSAHLIQLLMLTLSISWTNADSSSCQAKLDNCTNMVRPYLNDLRYMFPTNLQDVDEMCRMWSQFVDCVRRYVSACFSEERRAQFHKSVEHSVDTVHAICSSQLYQKEYLSSAECFKRISIENCGEFYKQLIEHVSNPRAHDDHICCSYGQFKNCVNDPLLRECGPRARRLMDHSMGFLISRCSHITHYNEKCPSLPLVIIDTTTITEEFNNANDLAVSADREDREDRSFNPEVVTTTWAPRTVVYTLPSEAGSRTSSSDSLIKKSNIYAQKLWSILLIVITYALIY